MRSALNQVGFGLLLAAVLIASAEISARVDDLVRRDIPFWQVPDDQFDLVTIDSLGPRGKPGGHYKSVRLNSFGFRGREMSLKPAPGCVRVMILGASETLGSSVSDSKDYPAQLQDSLNQHGGCYEVVNAGVPGLSIRGIIQLWTNWGFRFAPQIVVVYPTAFFYLAEHAPDFRSQREEARRPSWYTLRLFTKLRENITFPRFIQRQRVAWQVAREAGGRQADWIFRSIPEDRLQQFGADLDSLIQSIASSGAEPILLTHAIRFSNPPQADDQELLERWRDFWPRSTAEVLLAFERACQGSVMDLGIRRGVMVIDVAAAMSGKRRWFEDAVHFTDTGAGVLAGLIANGIVGASRSRGYLSSR